jgi:phage anti-repressor protein
LKTAFDLKFSGEHMSFQAYLDNVEEKTGKTPNDFIAEAQEKNLTEFNDILAWLKKDYGLGVGHARAVAYVIRNGPNFEVRQTTGPHRDISGTLKLDGARRKSSQAKKK